MNRRSLLGVLGPLVVSPLAGCLATNTDASPTATPRTTPATPATPNKDPHVTDHAIGTTETGCHDDSADDHVDIAFCTDRVVLDGRTTAPNPCHEATITAVSIEQTALTVRIGADPTDEVCIECVGRIEYLASIDVTRVNTLQTVRVSHPNGETHTVTRDPPSERTPS